MNTKPDGTGTRACWFVGAAYGGVDDQVSRFLDEGIWENNNQDKYLDLVKSIQPGDRIARYPRSSVDRVSSDSVSIYLEEVFRLGKS